MRKLRQIQGSKVAYSHGYQAIESIFLTTCRPGPEEITCLCPVANQEGALTVSSSRVEARSTLFSFFP